MKNWTDREKDYLRKNYSTDFDRNIALKLKRTLKAISYMANKLGLKKDRDFYCKARRKKKINFTKELLKRLYMEEKKSTRRIASEFNVGKTTIEYYFKKFKIPRRTHSESNKIRFLTETTWMKGLNKETDLRIKKMAKKIRETYKKKREKRIREIESKFGKPLKEIINHLYWKKELSQKQIAKELSLDRSKVINLMKKFKIKKRPNYKYISSLKGKDHSMFGKTWELCFGKEEADKKRKEYSKRFRNLTIKRLENNEFPFFDTKIERIMAKQLLKRKIPFVKQFKIKNKFVCDFAIPLFKIIIECDGDYWHANPKIYNQDKLTKTQKDKIQRDKFKDSFLKREGWIVLRFFESDIKSDINECFFKIENTINKKMKELKKIKSPIDTL